MATSRAFFASPPSSDSINCNRCIFVTSNQVKMPTLFFRSTHHCADKNNERYTVNYTLNGLCTEILFMISIHIHTLLLPNLNIHIGVQSTLFFFSSLHLAIASFTNIARKTETFAFQLFIEIEAEFFFQLSLEGNFFFTRSSIDWQFRCLFRFVSHVTSHAFSHTFLQFHENLLEFDPILKHLLKIGGSGFNRVSFFFSFISILTIFFIAFVLIYR